MFVRTDAVLYKGFAGSGITAARQGTALVALYDTRPHGIWYYSIGGKMELYKGDFREICSTP